MLRFSRLCLKVRGKAAESMVESLEANAEKIKASGVNPKYAASAIDAKGAETVNVDASVLKQAYGQTGGELRKIAESLGVTNEQIDAAAASGQDISVTRGNLTATMASVSGFAQTVHEHISFDDGGDSISYAQMQEDFSAAYDAGAQAEEELNIELDRIVASAKEAGMAEPHAEGLRTLLESRALIANPANPAKWLEQHSLSFASAGKRGQSGTGSKGLYQQGVISADERLSRDEKIFSNVVDKFINGKLKHNTVRVMRTPIVMELVGAQNLPIEMSATYIKKVLVDKHSAKRDKYGNDITVDLFKQVPRALADPLMILNSYTGKNNEKRVVAVLDLKTKNGAAVIVPFELNADSQNKRYVINEMVSAYAKTYKHGVPNNEWFAKQIEDGNLLYMNKSRAANVLGNEKLYSLMPYLNANSSTFTTIIADEESLRKYRATQKGYYQESGEEYKGELRPQDDGSYIISLFRGADASTVIHETGHYFFDTFMKDSALPDADANMKRDRQRLLDYVGMSESQWNAADIEGRTAAHEKLAEAFEPYIDEQAAGRYHQQSARKAETMAG